MKTGLFAFFGLPDIECNSGSQETVQGFGLRGATRSYVTHHITLQFHFSSGALIWVAVKQLNLSYYIGETPFFTIYTHYGNLI